MARMSVSPQKAKKILKHGSVRDHKLSKAQRGYFGARAGGMSMKRPKRARGGHSGY